MTTPRQPAGPHGESVVTVAVVEDHPLYREALVRALADQPDLDVVASGGSVAAVDRLVAARTPDVVVLDLSVPGLHGAAAVRALAARGTRVLVVSGTAVLDEISGVLDAGAAGFVSKSAESAEIASAVRAVAAGLGFIAPTVAPLLLAAQRRRAEELSGLTARERTVLGLLAEGLTDQQIAERLVVGVSTVRSTLDRVREKTGRRRRAELTRFAVEHGLA